MVFDLETLRRILPDSRFVNLSGNEIFTVLNIAHLKQFEATSSEDRILYFCVYEDDPNLMGWYNNPFDRSLNIQKIRTDERVTFVVDQRVPEDRVHRIRHIRVGNIYDAIDCIRRHVLSQINPQVIGVTGSVGKTTGVALIQSILEKGLSCGRIYSKRLTPLTLSSWLVNFLDSSHRVLALEYSMYRKDHIDRLTDILTPDIGVFLNVKRMHLGVQGINSLQDIVEGKEALVRKSKLGVLNIDEPLVSQLKRHGDLTFSLRDKQADAFIFTDGDEAVLILNSTGHEIRFVPYIKTSLFYYQASVAGLIGVQFGISPELITNALEDFRPAENRINWIDVKGHQVLFDGDVTVSGRMASLSEHHYTTSILMIHSFDFGEENIDLQVDDFSQVFSTFSEVRVLDTEENRTIISKYSLRNIIFVTKDDFLSGLSKFEFKVLHFGTYFRKYKDLSFLMQFIAV